MKTLIISSVVSVALLVVTIIVGDYYGLWGQINVSKMEITNIRFRASEEGTGTPVVDYHIRCSSQGSNDICSTANYRTTALGEKTVKIGLHQDYKKGLIFMHPVATGNDESRLIHIWVLHTDYHGQTIDISSSDLLAYTDTPMLLTLNPRYTDEEEGSETDENPH